MAGRRGVLGYLDDSMVLCSVRFTDDRRRHFPMAGKAKMKFPRWRWLAVAFLVVFIYQLTALNFDALLAIQHWAVKVAALIAAILALFKYVQEAWRIMTDDFVHTMGRDVSERGLWKRIL